MSSLGSILARAGLLSDGQVQAAREYAATEQLRFVEALINLGLRSEEELCAFLQNKLMIPFGKPEVLARAPRKVTELIPGAMAHRLLAFPIAADGRGNLTVIMADPSDDTAADEIARHTGAYVVRAVVKLQSVKNAIERTYPGAGLDPGATQPAMTRPEHQDWERSETIPGSLPVPEELSQISSPGRSPTVEYLSPVAGPAASQSGVIPSASQSGPVASASHSGLSFRPPRPDDSLSAPVQRGLSSDAVQSGVPSVAPYLQDSGPIAVKPGQRRPGSHAATSKPAPAPSPPAVQPPTVAPPKIQPQPQPPTVAPPKIQPPRVQAPVVPPPAAPATAGQSITLDRPVSVTPVGTVAPRGVTPAASNLPAPPLSQEAYAKLVPQLLAVADRDALTNLVLDFLAEGFTRVILFVHSRGSLRGHDARGADLMVDAVRQVRIPSDGNSVFARAISSKRASFGPLRGDDPIDQAFSQAFGGLSGNVLMLPIPAGKVVPLVVFGHGSRHPVDPRTMQELADGVAGALGRLIAAKRRGG